MITQRDENMYQKVIKRLKKNAISLASKWFGTSDCFRSFPIWGIAPFACVAAHRCASMRRRRRLRRCVTQRERCIGTIARSITYVAYTPGKYVYIRTYIERFRETEARNGCSFPREVCRFLRYYVSPGTCVVLPPATQSRAPFFPSGIFRIPS